MIGITGSKGFVGGHLSNYLTYVLGKEVRTYDAIDFADQNGLDDFVSSCSTIVHLAAVNRHEDEQVLYDTNLRLVDRLLEALSRKQVTPHLIFSSSTHIERDSLYGRSKKLGGEKLIEWGRQNGAVVSNMVIPNVFGPFCQPKYNSVVATFCHRLAHDLEPEVHQDSRLGLIYVQELVEEMARLIENPVAGTLYIEAPHQLGLMDLADRLRRFDTKYRAEGSIPDLSNPTDRALFNTYYTYLYAARAEEAQDGGWPKHFQKHTDPRGSFLEVMRCEGRGQFSYSTTHPGITRGNHFHTRKAERFAVIQGKARIEIRKVGEEKVNRFELDGSAPSFVDMPIWHTHNITNTGDETLVCLFWISEAYDPQDADTYMLAV